MVRNLGKRGSWVEMRDSWRHVVAEFLVYVAQKDEIRYTYMLIIN